MSPRHGGAPTGRGAASLTALAWTRLRLIRRWSGALVCAPLHVMFIAGAVTLFYAPHREVLAGFLYDAHFFWHRATGLWLEYLGGLLLIGYLLSAASEAVLLLRGRRGGSRPRGVLRRAAQLPRVAYAYTGALMVLGPLLVAAAIGPVFDGDAKRALRVAGYFGEELAEERVPEPGPEAPALPLDAPVAAARAAEPRLVVESLSAVNYGHDNGTLDVRGSIVTSPSLTMSAQRDTSVRVRTSDARVLEVRESSHEGATAFVAHWLQGIHHGWYAGVWVRALLLVLVVAGSSAFVARHFRWPSRRGRSAGRLALPCRVLARWTLGVGSGTFVATAALFVASRILPLTGQAGTVAEETVFPAALAACVGWALVASDSIRCCTRPLGLAGFALLLVPVLAARGSNAGLFGVGPCLPDVVAVDAGLLAASLALLGAAAAIDFGS